MVLLESIMSLQFRPSTSLSNCGHFWGSEERRAANFMVPWSKVNRRRETDDNCFARMKNELTRTIRVRRKCLGSGSGLIGENGKNSYHPFEDILNTEDTGIEERRLTAAETSRTIVEVNSKATLMFSGMAEGRVLHNLFWPDLPYLTDEHGNVYFQVNIDEDIMQALTSADNYVHVILGVDTREALGPGEVIDFGIKEIEEEDTDSDEEDEDSDDDEEDEDSDDDEDIVDFDFDEEWVDILEDEEDEDEVDSNGSLGDWAELETMHSSHPMSFATKIAEAQHASNNPIDYMKQPQDGLAIQGLIRPAFIEEQSIIQKHRSNHETDGSQDTYISKDDNNIDDKDIGQVNGHAIELFSSEDNGWAEDIEKDYNTGVGKTFYKLEMIKIELILASGHQAVVDVDEYRKACPDAIAHSASKIISHVNAGGEKTTHALKTLCWKCKGIHVEEASLIGVDTLGFDLRVCSGTQIQTLRFAFNSRATSEYSAERQLNDLLFPRSNQKPQKVKQAQQKDG